MADRIVVMNGGKVEQVGGPLEIYDTPMSRFVAGFFGTPTMNFLEGEIVNQNGEHLFRSSSIEIPLPNDDLKDLTTKNVILGIRSEHVNISSGDQKGQVKLIEPLGDTTLVFFEFGEEEQLVAKVGPDLRLSRGDPLTFSFQVDNCHLFDSSSGVRLN